MQVRWVGLGLPLKVETRVESHWDRHATMGPMGIRVEIGELGERIRALLSRVLEGEVIEIVDNERPIARIVPVGAEGLDQLALEGRLTESSRDLLDLADELGLPVNARGRMLPSEALAELRDDNR